MFWNTILIIETKAIQNLTVYYHAFYIFQQFLCLGHSCTFCNVAFGGGSFITHFLPLFALY